jgi:transposase
MDDELRVLDLNDFFLCCRWSIAAGSRGRVIPWPVRTSRTAKGVVPRKFHVDMPVRKNTSQAGRSETFIAGLRFDPLTAPFVIDAPMDRRIFETYVETQLAATLKPGDVVVLDNLAAHKSPAAEQAFAPWALGSFIPPYSPDLNPIEMAFAKLKACLRARAVSWRRLAKDWENLATTLQAFVALAAIQIAIRRLAR